MSSSRLDSSDASEYPSTFVDQIRHQRRQWMTAAKTLVPVVRRRNSQNTEMRVTIRLRRGTIRFSLTRSRFISTDRRRVQRAGPRQR